MELTGHTQLFTLTSRILENLIKVYQDIGDLGKAKECSIKAVDVDRKILKPIMNVLALYSGFLN